MKTLLTLCCALAITLLQALTPETADKVHRALSDGRDWLAAAQNADGSWSDRRFPGMSALALTALNESGDAAYADESAKAVTYLLACAQADGGIYVPIPGRVGGGLGNYNTCLCLKALHAADTKREHTAILLAARAYIASTQQQTEGLHEGGFGYDRDSRRIYTDLNNTFYATDVMRATEDLEEARPAGQKKVDIDWDKAKRYILSLQETEGAEEGGFLYRHDVARRVQPGVDPGETLRATGSMTYAGLLAMLHCKLSRSDPRVRSTLLFLGKHWSLKENYGQGVQGLYFYYYVIARALDAAGVRKLETPEDPAVDWREALALEILSRQRADGSWVNSNNRYWEGDPVLSTAYALLALQLTLR